MANVGIFVHDLGSREIRVRFDAPVTDAENVDFYSISSGSGYVPNITQVSYFDSNRTSVSLKLDAALTFGETYSCAVMNLYGVDGSSVTSVPFDFTSNDEQDRPHVLTSVLSKRGNIDLIFDRPVGQYSVSAVASLFSRSGGSVPMVLVPWNEDQHENSVRFSFTSADPGTSYYIEYSLVNDISNNSSSGEIDLQVPYGLSGYSDLTQARITKAFVTDMSNADGFMTSVIRVYFNCPMLNSDVINISKWNVKQSGSHIDSNLSNQITAANAVSNSTFIALANETKLKFNSHILSNAHKAYDKLGQITTPDATSYETAQVLTNVIYSAYSSHCEKVSMHLYADHVNLPVLSTNPMTTLNSIKSKFNKHILKEFDIDFSYEYSPLGPIVNFSSYNNSPFVQDEYTWFVDLHMKSDAFKANFTVSCVGISSEEFGSLASSSYSFGPVENNFNVLSVSPLFRGVRVKTEFDVNVRDTDLISINNIDNFYEPVKSSYAVRASLPVLLWALNNVIHSYKIHISDPLTSPYLGASHKVIDTVNLVGPGDYAIQMDLDSIISKANNFKHKLNNHLLSEEYHFGQDVSVSEVDAYDSISLLNLIQSFRNKITSHNSFGFQPRPSGVPSSGMLPLFPYFHNYPGVSIVSSVILDTIDIRFDGINDAKKHKLVIPVIKSWKDNRPDVKNRVKLGKIVEEFKSVDNHPVLVSAVARPGYSKNEPEYLMPDRVELYLSKAMRNQSLFNSNVSISGSVIDLINVDWINDKVISVCVTNMSSVLYAVEAFDVCDTFGNPIQ